jgi:phosphatidylglycerophosphatase A
MIKKLNILIVTMFGVGNSKYAPGTVASFLTCLIYIIFFSQEVNILILVLFVCLVFFYTIYVLDELKNSFSSIDASEIVIDEFVGQSIPVLSVYNLVEFSSINNFIFYTFIVFIFFRIFDIFKPYPIGLIDRNIKNGFGVILDDIIAGIYAGILFLITFTFLNHV